MNEEILKNMKDNPELFKLFSEEELLAIFAVLNSDFSDAKKKDMIEVIIKEDRDENL